MQVAGLKAGDYFGENALLRNEPRNATIKANSQAIRLVTVGWFADNPESCITSLCFGYSFPTLGNVEPSVE